MELPVVVESIVVVPLAEDAVACVGDDEGDNVVVADGTLVKTTG